MKLDNYTVAALNVGDSIFYNEKEYIVTKVTQSVIDPKRWYIDVKGIEEEISGSLELKDVYGSEVIQCKSWQTRMTYLKTELEELSNTLDNDLEKYIEKGMKDIFDDFQIIYKGQKIRIPMDLAGFFNPVQQLLDECLVEVEEQID